MEVLGLNQHHQEAVGRREVADGEKDLSRSCRRLLKHERECQRCLPLGAAPAPSTSGKARIPLFVSNGHPRSHLPISTGFSTSAEGSGAQKDYMCICFNKSLFRLPQNGIFPIPLYSNPTDETDQRMPLRMWLGRGSGLPLTLLCPCPSS